MVKSHAFLIRYYLPSQPSISAASETTLPVNNHKQTDQAQTNDIDGRNPAPFDR